MARFVLNKSVSLPKKRMTTTYHWTVDYAAEVHEGSFYLEGREMPRPWVDVTVSEYVDLPSIMGDRIRQTKSFKDGFVSASLDLAQAFGDVIDDYDWGYESDYEKTYRTGVNTWQFITDSGALRDSLDVKTRGV